MPSRIYLFHHHLHFSPQELAERLHRSRLKSETLATEKADTAFHRLTREAGLEFLKALDTKNAAGVFKSELVEFAPELKSGDAFLRTLSVVRFSEFVDYLSAVYAMFMADAEADPRTDWEEILSQFSEEQLQSARKVLWQEQDLKEDLSHSCGLSAFDYWDAAWQFWEMRELLEKLEEMNGYVTVWEE